MLRRKFIALVGGMAAVWPVAALSQPGRMRRIGVLSVSPESDSVVMTRIGAFRQELQKLGWTEGSNVRFEQRFALGDLDLLRFYANDLAEMKPDVILSVG